MDFDSLAEGRVALKNALGNCDHQASECERERERERRKNAKKKLKSKITLVVDGNTEKVLS